MSRYRRLQVAILAVAAVLRLSGIGWDGWRHQHPDERFLVMVAERLAMPASPAQALDPELTPANPNNVGFDFYVYGALPPQATAAFAALLGAKSYVGLLVVGRCLAVLMDLLALGFVMSLARRLGGEGSALIAGALYATCAVFIQQSRFGTCDVWGVAAVLALAWAVVARPLGVAQLLAAGAALGAAVACRPNLLLAAVIPAVAIAVAAFQKDRDGDQGRTAWGTIGWAAGALALVASAAFVILKVADPGAFASFWSVWPGPRRLAALRQVAAIAAGAGQYPPNLQWADRRMVLEPLANVLIWGTGPALGVLLPLALGHRLRRAALGERTWLPLLAWVLPLAAWHLTRMVCAVRYFEPLLPFAIIAAAVWLADRRRRRLAVVAVVATALWGGLWASVAWRPYTRVEASRWLRDAAPAGAVVTSEYWDDALPLPGLGPEGAAIVETRVFDPDTAAKRESLLGVLQHADFVVLASQRGVGSICRVPDAYPLTSEYYHLLFSGALGFEQAVTFQRRIGIGRFSLATLGADESLSVYDHPPVWIFRKTAAYTPELARALLERVDLSSGADRWQTRDLEARGSPPYLQRADSSRPLPGGWRSGAGEQTVRLLLWLGILELAGLAGRRLLRVLGVTLPDGGWGVARWLGLAAVGVVWLWLGWAGVPGWNTWLPVGAAVLAAPWGVRELRRAWREPEFRSVGLAVWSVLALFLVVRALNPEIYWGEKPMDSAILAGLLRADSLPPSDPWLAGEPINYYFFGFLPFAFMARASGASLGLAFNLAVATVPALTAGCAVSIGWLLSGRRLGGWLAALLAQLTGTFAALVHPGLLAHPDFSRFWATSRVIGTTINEYPVWTALFADLHAHFLGFPGFLAGVLAAGAVALRRIRLRAGALLAGGVVAVEMMTNTWEMPALVVLLGAAALAAPRAGASRRRLVQGAGFLALAVFVAVVLTFPYWSSTRTAGAGLAINRLLPPPLAAFGELFGVLAVVAAVCGAATVLTRSCPPAVRWGWWLVAVGTSLVWAPELVTVADRMNTVFKVHLQAHLLLGAALGGLLAAALPRVSGWQRPVLAAVAAGAIAVGLATSVADTRAVIATRRVPGPRPTLDGVAYLDTHAAGQAAVIRALAATESGGAVFEPPGEPYSDSMRAPMFSGRPALVGWEYHLWQRNHARAEIALRRQDLDTLWYGQDWSVVAALARRYRVTAACGWDGDRPAVAELPGWRVVTAAEGATLSLAPAGGAP